MYILEKFRGQVFVISQTIIDKTIVDLICDLEYDIGSEAYNPNSYNGYKQEDGCAYKYPVNYYKNKNEMSDR